MLSYLINWFYPLPVLKPQFRNCNTIVVGSQLPRETMVTLQSISNWMRMVKKEEILLINDQDDPKLAHSMFIYRTGNVLWTKRLSGIVIEILLRTDYILFTRDSDVEELLFLKRLLLKDLPHDTILGQLFEIHKEKGLLVSLDGNLYEYSST